MEVDLNTESRQRRDDCSEQRHLDADPPAGGGIRRLVATTTFSGRGSLDSIKSKTVGDGQHGTARWATPGEIKKTFRSVPFQTALWRKGERLPGTQGLVLGCTGKKG